MNIVLQMGKNGVDVEELYSLGMGMLRVSSLYTDTGNKRVV